MEISTKERLTGALLVVLALVVVVPELLSGRRAADPGTPPAQNPEEGAPLQTYNMQLDAANTVPAVPRDVPAAAAAESAAVPLPVTQDAPPPVKTPAAVAVAAPPEVNVPVKPTPTADSRPSESKPSMESEPTKPSASTPASAGKWWVQLGSFESRDNAQHLAQKLRAAGFMIDVSQGRTKGKELYRVRAGPVADEVAADALQAHLAAAGEKKSSLVAP